MNEYIEKSKGFRLQGLDSCIVGLCKNDYLVYSHTRLLEHFCKDSELMDAIEYIDYNIVSIAREDTFKILYD